MLPRVHDPEYWVGCEVWPGAVVIDRKGKLWIGESMSGKVHVIKYLGVNLVKTPVQRPTALTFGAVIRSTTATKLSKVV